MIPNTFRSEAGSDVLTRTSRNNAGAGSIDTATVAVIGLGYVGFPLALLLRSKGRAVIGIDIAEERIRAMKKGRSPIAGEEERDMASDQALIRSIQGTQDVSRIRDAEIIVITVPTPVHHDHRPDLGPLEAASRSIAPFLEGGELVIVESTVNPGITNHVVRPLLESGSGLRAGSDFSLAHAPERIDPGNPKWNVKNIPRVVGGHDATSLDHAVEFYRSILDAEVKPMASLEEAEAVKIVENSFRDINIAFVNELAMSFDRLGIDVAHVLAGAATKPFGFMPFAPGCGVGGHCIPVDPYYLIAYAEANGFSHDLLAWARRVNNGMPHFTVEVLAREMNEAGLILKGATVALLGLAYKPGLADTRESPAFAIIERLQEYGANVLTYDPHVPDGSTARDLASAIHGAQAVLIATAHDEFLRLQPERIRQAGISVLIDGRNCLDKDAFLAAGIRYRGIGR